MIPTWHETAIIDQTAEVHPSAIIGPYSVIGARVKIGAGTRIGCHCTIGGPPESIEHWDNWLYGVRIGADCWISNGVTIDSGTERHTTVEANCFILRQAHVGHDAHIQQNVTLSCSVLIGGHSIIMPFTNCGLGSIVHQRCVVGALVMLGSNSFVAKAHPAEPFGVYVGSPAKFLKRNEIGIKRSGLDEASLSALKRDYDELVTAK